MVQELLRRNREWAAQQIAENPEFFPRLAKGQSPDMFWIGCSDSRVPANVIAGLDPGEVFVHRNVANVVHSADLNMLSALEYSVEVLGVGMIVVCGHYGCGGVKASMQPPGDALVEHWLEPIRRVARRHREELEGLSGEARENRLCELNVIEGVARVADTPILQHAWERGTDIVVHSMIYGLKDGRLKELGFSIGLEDWQAS